ncbi:MAG: M48 family metallopeptidase [Bacteroidota bacterium]
MQVKTLISKTPIISLILIISFILAACSKVVFTGRSQIKLIPSSTLNEMSIAQYNDFLQKNKVVRSGTDAQRVERVGKRIQQAVEKYYRANGLADELKEFAWEFNLVDDAAVNAWAMPGGKIVVYSGILPVAKDDNGLAVIMGHELAHALAHHGNERMTQTLGLQGALAGIGAYMQSRKGQTQTAEEKQRAERTQSIFMAAMGLGAQVGVLLPFSRKHESEADKIGLYLMAIAGYDVYQAAPFWQRMQQKGGQTPPEFMSTHPSPDTRAKNLQEWAPEALRLAKNYR